MLASSMPLGRAPSASCWRTMNSTLQRIAMDSAICSAMSTAPTLLRASVDRMACIPASSVNLELPGRLYVHGSPRWIEARENSRRYDRKHRDQQVIAIHVEERT